MSVMVLERGLAAESDGTDRMPRGIALSAVLHLGVLTLIIIGLPNLFRPAVPDDQPIAVELVTIAPETRATRPNPNPPKPNAKPDLPIPAVPAPKPEPKPEPPQPTAAAPPSSEPPPPPPTPPQPEAQAPPAPPPPPPKAVETPAPPPPPPKPPEPKPKPEAKPQQVAQAQQPKPPDSKANEMAFDSLLKNLSKQAATPTPDAPPKRQPTPAAAPPSSQPKAPLGSQLTANELDLVREQIKRCWNVPAGARDAKDLVVDIRATVNADGTVATAVIVDTGRAAGDPLFRAAAESARRAFFNPLCTPLKLPPEKYATWKDLTVTLSPGNL
jgi:outer membrane biosynthesis protein TonB